MSFYRQWSELYGLEVRRMIRNMRDNGMSIRSVAKEMGISRNSVSKYLKNEPVRKHKQKRGSKLDPYKDIIKTLIFILMMPPIV